MAETLGQMVRRLRESLGFTQGQLATNADVSRSWIARVEGDERSRPDPDMLKRIAVHLQVPANTLLAAAGYNVLPEGTPPNRTPEEIAAELTVAIRRQREEAERHRAELEAGRITPIASKLLILQVHDHPLSADATPTGYIPEDVAFFDAPEEADPERYQAYYVSGDCLQGRVEPGTTIVVDLRAQPKDGDIVAVINGDMLIKILTKTSDGYYLTTLNGQPPIKVTDETRMLGVVKKMITSL